MKIMQASAYTAKKTEVFIFCFLFWFTAQLVKSMGEVKYSIYYVCMDALFSLVFASAFVFFRYILPEKFSKEQIVRSLQCDLSDKKVAVHYTKPALFPPKIIRFDEIKKLTCCFTNRLFGQEVTLNFQTLDDKNIFLDLKSEEYARIKFISLLQGQKDFEVELKYCPTLVLDKLTRFQNGEKLSFWDKYADRVKCCSALVFIYFILLSAFILIK